MLYEFFYLDRGIGNRRIVSMRMENLSRRLEASDVWALTHEERNDNYKFKDEKYALCYNEIVNSKCIVIPEIMRVDHDNLYLMDGRHRLYAMIDLGYDETLLQVPEEYFDAIQALGAIPYDVAP